MEINIIKPFKCSSNGFNVVVLKEGLHNVDDFLGKIAIEKGYAELVNKEETVDIVEKVDIYSMSIRKLKDYCNELGIKGCSNKSKDEIIKILEAANA